MTTTYNALLTLFLIGASLGVPFASADEFSSRDFKVLNPTLVPAGYSTSTDFQLIGTIGEPAIGTSTASGFELGSGSLYFAGVSTVSTPTPSPSPSGGGGGETISTPAGVTFSGRAYPGRKVTLLKDAQVAASVFADPDAAFRISLSGLSAGNYIFSMYSEDVKGIRSLLTTYPVTVTSGVTLEVGGIFIAPSIAIDKSEVKRGEDVIVFGQSAPKAEVIIAVHSEEESLGKTTTDANGVYLYHLDTARLSFGPHLAKSKASLSATASPFGKIVSFLVGTQTTLASSPSQPFIGELNHDGRVNLVDFSIAAYWYKRAHAPASVDFNRDGNVDLIDFSIMAFNWTG